MYDLLRFHSLSLVFRCFFTSYFHVNKSVLAKSCCCFEVKVFFPDLRPINQFRGTRHFPHPTYFAQGGFILSSGSLRGPCGSTRVHFLPNTLCVSWGRLGFTIRSIVLGTTWSFSLFLRHILGHFHFSSNYDTFPIFTGRRLVM